MRSKMYFILYPVYLLTVAFILWINGVFTGNVTDWTNLIINLSFLLVIGVLFAISTVSLTRLTGCTKELVTVAERLQKEYKENNGRSLWGAYQERKDFFQNQSLRTAYAKYRMMMRNYRTKRGFTKECDMEEYINEELLEREGAGHFNQAMAGTLTGLGILGTFLGLSMGLGSFNGDDIYAVTDNVGTLLGGMKVAFHTSVYGIFFSLVFSFIYKGLLADTYEKLTFFLDTFRQCVVPPVISEEENLSAMLVYQANMSNSMKQILELMQGQAKEQVAGVERIVDKCMEQLSTAMNTDLKQNGRLLQETTEAQRVAAENSRILLDTMQALLEMNQKYEEAWKLVLGRQDVFAKLLQEQKTKIENTCDSISEDISNQLYTFGQIRE